jgi:hypothetical protein
LGFLIFLRVCRVCGGHNLFHARVEVR